MSLAASVLANQYVAVAGVAALIYDHAMTLEDEIRLIWFNSASGIRNRLGFIVNRYVTEALAFTERRKIQRRTSYSQRLTIVVEHSFGFLAYRRHLWERRRVIKWLLIGASAVALSVSLAFMVVVADEGQVESGRVCTVLEKPWALPYALGALSGLDFFVIAMTVLNALDRPRTCQADVMKDLQRDGALMFLFLFFLRILNLILSIVGNATYCFVTVTLVWSMCSIVTSRIQLRVEELRFIRFSNIVLESMELRGFN
ncbi:hypothetical protein B0H11DRAFT_2193563 [Mycena galericulata]|nr:hypothetical protein B0H11DRAFT_2193563 [Mycena galericulata]